MTRCSSVTAAELIPFHRSYPEIISGYAGGTWTGTGIMSTNAQTNAGTMGSVMPIRLIRVIRQAWPPVPIEVLYTLLGDANLD